MNLKQLLSRARGLEIDGETKAALIDLIEQAHGGLVFEDKPEPLEKRLQNETPIFIEVSERAVLSDNEAPSHILIEGDNLHALTCLAFTHERAVDVIYIDPPYNTGNKDFRYNDRYVDKEDGYRHSKWLSFMSKRLRIAKQLLKDTGVIFISIDDNEQAQLKLLCDQIFGQENFAACIVWQKVYSPRMDAVGFSVSHDYLLCYVKYDIISSIKRLNFKQDEGQFNFIDNSNGKKYRRRSIRKEGSNSLRINAPNSFFPLLSPENTEIYPIKPDGTEGCWRWSKDTYEENLHNGFVEWVKSGNIWQVYAKQYLNDEATKPPETIWFHEEVNHNHGASEELKNIIGGRIFTSPKPKELIKKCLNIATNKNSLVLDFFAGSGTTMHAVMQLNAEDGGNRQCILVTDNENGIAEEVCYERCKRVIQGYTNARGAQVAGLTRNHLRYYRTGFVEK